MGNRVMADRKFILRCGKCGKELKIISEDNLRYIRCSKHPKAQAVFSFATNSTYIKNKR